MVGGGLPCSMAAQTEHTTIYTVGHSTRSAGEFVALLESHGIRTLIDVRTIPRSRRNPQFGSDELAKTLTEAGIEYRWMRSLGGLRRPQPDSVNVAWRNDSFRGYADYMQTPEFAAAVEQLIELGSGGDLVIMCAEAVPWRCHRSLIGDALLVRGVEVLDIFDAKNSRPHKLTPFAKLDGERITYPSDGAEEVTGHEGSKGLTC